MKKWTTRLLLMALLLSFAIALPTMAAVKPGENVTVTLPVSASSPVVSWRITYVVSEGLEFVSGKLIGSRVSARAAVGNDYGGTTLSGQELTLNYKVKADATGNQTVKIDYANGAINSEEGVQIAELKTFTFAVEAPEVPEVWGEWKVVTPATCDKVGKEERVSDKGTKETRDIPALNHSWGPWAEVKAPTCLVAGSEERVCKTDKTHTETRAIPALDHDWGEWKVVTPATCTTKGLEERVCKNDPTHKETRDIPLVPHAEGPWVVVREATEKEPGLRVKYCTVGGEVLKEEAIPFITTIFYAKNTASTEGIRFRDIKPEVTNKWYMFTPVDLSQDGEQVFPIIATNMYYVGQVKLNVAEGEVTVDYEFAKGINVRKAFLTFFLSLEEVTNVEPSTIAYKAEKFGQPLNIEKVLAGDTHVLLYTNFLIDYNDSLRGVSRFLHSAPAYKQLVENLKTLMD